LNQDELTRFVEPWSPWLDAEEREKWERLLPDFHRPVFGKLIEDICSLEQIISITGPRRVGKSTLLKQIAKYLLHDRHVDPSRVVYYQFDDPALFRASISGGELLESLMERMCRLGKPAYLMLDEIQTLERWEIQTLERWEQYLKKYYDLKYPVRVIVSGSASSPIFKKTRESLLGRVKDYHVLPFSFREFLLFRLQEKGLTNLVEEVERLQDVGSKVKGMLVKSPQHVDTESVTVQRMSDQLWEQAEGALNDYFVEGGFPEVWTLPTQEKKIEYLFDNQVKKVIYEDLVLATEFRKPEQLKMFYISLLERPGQEVNLTSLSKEINIGVQQIEKYLPLLEMTDLLAHASKFRRSAVRQRQGSRKYYLVDLALRNAVLRIGPEVLQDEAMLGLYAENLVFNVLKKWDGTLQVDYYREKTHEVDFIVHTRPSQYLPVEVKYRPAKRKGSLAGLKKFTTKHPCHLSTIVTKDRDDYGRRQETNAFHCPLPLFLVLFD
jgi:predicted AAA+ superfamily ATPase